MWQCLLIAYQEMHLLECIADRLTLLVDSSMQTMHYNGEQGNAMVKQALCFAPSSSSVQLADNFTDFQGFLVLHAIQPIYLGDSSWVYIVGVISLANLEPAVRYIACFDPGIVSLRLAVSQILLGFCLASVWLYRGVSSLSNMIHHYAHGVLMVPRVFLASAVVLPLYLAHNLLWFRGVPEVVFIYQIGHAYTSTQQGFHPTWEYGIWVPLLHSGYGQVFLSSITGQPNALLLAEVAPLRIPTLIYSCMVHCTIYNLHSVQRTAIGKLPYLQCNMHTEANLPSIISRATGVSLLLCFNPGIHFTASQVDMYSFLVLVFKDTGQSGMALLVCLHVLYVIHNLCLGSLISYSPAREIHKEQTLFSSFYSALPAIEADITCSLREMVSDSSVVLLIISRGSVRWHIIPKASYLLNYGASCLVVSLISIVASDDKFQYVNFFETSWTLILPRLLGTYLEIFRKGKTYAASAKHIDLEFLNFMILH